MSGSQPPTQTTAVPAPGADSVSEPTQILTKASEADEAIRWRVHDVALAMYIHEGDNVWARFNAILVVHALLIGGILSLDTGRRLITILCVMGIFMAILWLALTARGFAYHDTYLKTMKDMQRNEGEFANFPDKPKILVPVKFGRVEIPMSWFVLGTWWLQVRLSAFLVIYAFMGFYIAWLVRPFFL